RHDGPGRVEEGLELGHEEAHRLPLDAGAEALGGVEDHAGAGAERPVVQEGHAGVEQPVVSHRRRMVARGSGARHWSRMIAPVGGTETDVTGFVVIDPDAAPVGSIAPPPLGITWFIVAPRGTVTETSDGFTSTVPLAKSRR